MMEETAWTILSSTEQRSLTRLLNRAIQSADECLRDNTPAGDEKHRVNLRRYANEAREELADESNG